MHQIRAGRLLKIFSPRFSYRSKVKAFSLFLMLEVAWVIDNQLKSQELTTSVYRFRFPPSAGRNHMLGHKEPVPIWHIDFRRRGDRPSQGEISGQNLPVVFTSWFLNAFLIMLWKIIRMWPECKLLANLHKKSNNITYQFNFWELMANGAYRCQGDWQWLMMMHLSRRRPNKAGWQQ